jgi:ankyrin repeat protein
MGHIRIWIAVFAVSMAGGCGYTPHMAANPGKAHLAARSGDRSTMESALQSGIDVNQADGHGMTPLSYAAGTSNVATVEYLLGKGANPNHATDNNQTPLMIAARRSTPPVVELLIGKGAQIDRFGDDGLTALAIATQRGDPQIFDLLLKRGAKPNVSLANCDTALILSILQKDPIFFERLMAAGADPNGRGRAGNTPLIIATFSDKPGIVEKLLEAGARIDDANDAGNGALHFATGVRGINPFIAYLLVEKGGDVNKAAKDGLTPMKAACLTEQAALVPYLYEKGANPDFEHASDSGMEAGGAVHQILGDYFLGRGLLDKSRASYVESRDFYKMAADKYNGDVTRLQWKTVGAYAALALAGAAQSYAGSMQADMQARQMAQYSGMAYATRSGTGFQGYSAYMANYNATNVSTFKSVGTASPAVPYDQMPLSQQKSQAKEKAGQFEARTALIGKILECFDRNPGGGNGLRACVDTASKGFEAR